MENLFQKQFQSSSKFLRNTSKTKLSKTELFIYSKRQNLRTLHYETNAFHLYTISMYFAESCNKAKLYEWEHTRKTFGNPYNKKLTHALIQNNNM